MRNYVILSVSNRSTAVRLAVFGDVVEGRIPNARYLSTSTLCGLDDPFHRILTGGKLQRLLRHFPVLLPPVKRAAQSCLDRHFANADVDKLRALGLEGEQMDFIFCPTTILSRAPESLVHDLRKKCPGSRMLFYLVDGIVRTAEVNGISERALIDYLRCYDGVYTYDHRDAARYPGLIRYLGIPIWHSTEAPPATPEADLYFCGRDKGRAALLQSISQRLADAGGSLRARVVDLKTGAPNRNAPPRLQEKWIPYEATVSELLKCNCILELLAEHNVESTLRYKEAVIYNKKLLTNNPGIIHLPYYDPRWMRVFRTAEEIDLGWVRSVEAVDYGYRGDYSVQTFLEQLEEMDAQSAEGRAMA